MKLDHLIHRLKNIDPNFVPSVAISDPHSYRGFYDELAFQKYDNRVAIGYMIEMATWCIQRTFEGWKGGQYIMTPETECHLADIGTCSPEEDYEHDKNELEKLVYQIEEEYLESIRDKK